MKCIMLKHDITRHYDMTLNIALMYSIRYTEFETEEGYVLSFRLKEEINDLRTFTYFQNLLCYIFNTEPSNQNYCSPDTQEVSIYTIMLAFVDRVRSNYDERHYKEVIRRENKKADIEIIDSMPAIYKLKNGDYTLTPMVEYINGFYIGEMPAPENEIQKQAITRNKNKRAVYRNFNFNDLYESCNLYRAFCNGEQFYDMEQVFNIARNICGAEKGKQHFLDIVNNQQAQNGFIQSIHWKEILNTIIKDEIPIVPCSQCEYCKHCQHSENMLSTAKPRKTEIRQTRKNEYYPIEEVAQELNNAFEQAVNAQEQDIYIIKAQTGIGKTHTYLSYMKNTDKPLIIAVPTHNLKNEILKKARDMGIENICCTPDLDEYNLSEDLSNKINNLYAIGAGEYVLKFLTSQLKNLKFTDTDYVNISSYLILILNQQLEII